MENPENPDLKQPKQAAESSPYENMEDHQKRLWERTKRVCERLGVSYEEEEVIDKISDIEKGEEDRFLDIEVKRGDEVFELRIVAQADPDFNPDREKNYDNWNLTPEEEAVRWLNREAIVGEKLNKFLSGETISADGVIEANRDPKAGDMFVLKKTEGTKVGEGWGTQEGQMTARVLIDMKEKLNTTGMVKEIMNEEGIETKLEMEQKIFEDYFDHFEGYMENSGVILKNDISDKKTAKKIRENMEQYRSVIEGRQLGEDDYSFAHGNMSLDNIRFLPDGKALLSDWQRPGTTQNPELSMIYDLGDIFNDAVERSDSSGQAEEFIRGAEDEIKSRYDDPEIAEAVITLAKLRSFSMILDELEGEKKDFVEREMGLA